MTAPSNDMNVEDAHILVVDDEGAIRYSVSKTLQRVGYRVSEAASGEEALEHIDDQEFDVVLTDIRMEPGIDGVELLRQIKDRTPDASVILMTGYASLGTAIEALRLGAHDYLIKPSSSQDIKTSVSEGLNRSRSLKRRRDLLTTIQKNLTELHEHEIEENNGHNGEQEARNRDIPDTIPAPEPPSSMQLGVLTVYPGRYQISVHDKPIDLTPTEFDLLLYLAAHQGRVVSCHELVREVRGYSVGEAEAREVIRPHVSNLRRKLKNAGLQDGLIVNVRGIGYRLSERAV